MLVSGFRQVSKQLKAAIKNDKAHFIDQGVGEANGRRGADLYQALKPLRIGGKSRKMGIPPLPGFSADGVQPVDPDKSTDLWTQHCANMEAGVLTSTSRLLQRARRGSLERAAMVGDMDIHVVPSLLELEGAFRRVKKHKAGGVDDFKSDLCSLASGPLARKYHSLLQKIVCQVSEPVQMKGGLLIHMFKGGNASSVEDHRGLLLSSHVGKALRRTIRQSIMPSFVAHSSHTYFSIKTGGNVSQASHALRAFISASAQRHQSVGLLFLDIKSAYYRVVRQLLTSSAPREERIDRLMSYFDFNGVDQQTLRGAIAERVAEDDRMLTQHQELLLQELMASTWFTSSRKTELYESLAGSRPGDGLADVAFGLIFQRIMNIIMRRIKSELGIEGTDVHGMFDLVGGRIPDYEPPWLLEVIWADDLALALRCSHAGSLPGALQQITSIVFQECSRHGLVPNLKKGKTEILAIPKGPGCRSVRAELFKVQEPKIVIPDVSEELAEVRLVSCYKHLGARIHIGLRHMQEIKCRMGHAWSVFKKYRRQLFQNRRLQLHRRRFLFRSMVMSVFMYNVGTWGSLLKSEFRYFEKRLHSLYRGLARGDIPEVVLRLWSNERVRAFVQLPSAQEILHGARLRYSVSLYSSGPRTL